MTLRVSRLKGLLKQAGMGLHICRLYSLSRAQVCTVRKALVVRIGKRHVKVAKLPM